MGAQEITDDAGEPATPPTTASLRLGPHVARHTGPTLDPMPASGELPATPPRSQAVRILAGLGGVVLLLIPQTLIPTGFLGAVGPLGGRINVVTVVLYLAFPLAFLPALPRVSYRRRDWLVLLAVPVWQWALAFRVGYRLAFLPYRDWQPRPDEVVRARRIRGARTWVLPS